MVLYAQWRLGPPTEVAAYSGDRKVALLWKDPLDGVVASYQLRIDNSEWINILPTDLIFDPVANKWYYLITGLTNNVEYTFQIRAVSLEGVAGAAATIKSTPTPIGDIGGHDAGLSSIYGVSVIPDDGWKSSDGIQLTSPREAVITLPATLSMTSAHRNFIKVSEDASFILYSDCDYQNEAVIIDRIDAQYEWLPEVHLYIKVISGNQENIRFYDITVLPDI
jgi:hypothetical protein